MCQAGHDKITFKTKHNNASERRRWRVVEQWQRQQQQQKKCKPTEITTMKTTQWQ